MAKLHFYFSAMNAGKSTTLLQSSYNYRERGMETLLLIPAVVNVARQGRVASRIGLQEEAMSFSDEADLFVIVQQMLQGSKKIKCVLLDEAQFITKIQVIQLTKIVDILGIPVLAYGLRTDFLGEPFEASQYLLALAEELTEIKTICHCGRKAIMSLRIDQKGNPIRGGAQIEIGGNERYVAVCRRHFTEGRIREEESALL